MQAPPLQPNGHTKSVCVEEQVPLEQTGELKVRRVEPMQVAAGAVQAKVCEVKLHAPPEQVPGAL